MSSWEEAFSELREDYIRGADERLSRISDSLSILEKDPADKEALQELLRQFHGLSGSGATYGFPKVSAIGLQGEQECNGLKGENRLPGKRELDRWRYLLEELVNEFSKSDIETVEQYERLKKISTKPFSMLVVDDDEATRRVIIELSEQEGMMVFNVNTMADAMRALEDRLPDGLITNIYLPDGSGYELVEHVRNLSGGDFVTIFMVSTITNFLDKVEAIRCGADGYFEKPIEWEALSRRLRFLLERSRTEPARILSVEDDLDQAAFLRTVLESAGYQVFVCGEPKDFEAELARIRPDLVLMDVLLPGVSGYDLARFTRQNETYAMLPILFLTTQGQMENRMEAVKAGGDDHLVKPVSPSSLLTVVAARIERVQFLKNLLERDGLTRLLTHTAFLERLKIAIAQNHRDHQKLSALVMIDLDHFKSINDRYGHPVGDKVLASLSALLRKRLRQSDSVGRYGGEEFAILIEDLKQEEAARLVSRLLEEFSMLDHHAPDGSVFKVTFSAGVAILDPDIMDLDIWKQTADKALYAAKAAGRNRVMVAPVEKGR